MRQVARRRRGGSEAGALQAALQGIASPSVVTESTWTPIGPQPVGDGSFGWSEGVAPNSGRVTALAVKDPNTVYLGAAGGGVWKTTNGGTTWSPVTDNASGLANLAIGAITLDPTNPDMVYAGAKGYGPGNYFGLGILKSVDAGNSWSLIEPPQFQNQSTERIAVDPNNPNIVYAATSTGIAKSANAGQTWTFACLGVFCWASEVVIDPTTNPSTVYTVHGGWNPSPDDAIFKSTTAQANMQANWTKLPGTGANTFPSNVGYIRMAITRTTPPTLYASGNSRIYRTTDGGTNWIPVTTPASGDGITELAVYPTDPNLVYSLSTEMYRSRDGGTSWTLVSNAYTAPYKIHADQHSFAFIPGSPDTFFEGNDGGVYKSFDGGNTFNDLNQTLSISQMYRGAANPFSTTSILGGTQDEGSVSYENSLSWYRSFGGDRGYAAFDFLNPNNVLVTSQYLDIWRSTAGPRGSFSLTSGSIPSSSVEARQFIAPLVMDPNNPQVVYAGTTRLYRSADGGQTWSPISPILGTPNQWWAAISAIGISRTSANTLYVGTGGGPAKLWVTTDLGASWTDRTLGLPDRTITSVAVNPQDATQACLTVSGFGAPHVWKTTNRGKLD